MLPVIAIWLCIVASIVQAGNFTDEGLASYPSTSVYTIFNDLSTFSSNTLPNPIFVENDEYLSNQVIGLLADSSSLAESTAPLQIITPQYVDSKNRDQWIYPLAQVLKPMSSKSCPTIVAFQLKELKNISMDPSSTPGPISYTAQIQLIETPLPSDLKLPDRMQNVAYTKALLKYLNIDAEEMIGNFDTSDVDDAKFQFNDSTTMQKWSNTNTDICNSADCANTTLAKVLMSNSSFLSTASQWYDFSRMTPIDRLVEGYLLADTFNTAFASCEKKRFHHWYLYAASVQTSLICNSTDLTQQSADDFVNQSTLQVYHLNYTNVSLVSTGAPNDTTSSYACKARSNAQGTVGQKTLTSASGPRALVTESLKEKLVVNGLDATFNINPAMHKQFEDSALLAMFQSAKRTHQIQRTWNNAMDLTSWTKTLATTFTSGYAVSNYTDPMQRNLGTTKTVQCDYLVIGHIDECV